MTEILTTAQMRAIESAAIESGQVTGLALMERAGEGCVATILVRWPDMAAGPRRAIILCGPGNNGGDGFVIARLLHGLAWDVAVFMAGDPKALPPDARVNFLRWQELGLVRPLSAFRHDSAACDLYVDALFGIGLSRPFVPETGPAPLLPPRDARQRGRVVAVDVPSGLCADSGKLLGRKMPETGALWADLTVTFHRPKPGHFLAEGPETCGETVVCDIGLHALSSGGHAITLVRGDLARQICRKGGQGHKFSYGHALVLGGGAGRGGAARLAARGALRAGAGVVTLVCPPDALPENAARLDAVMLRPVAGAAGLHDLLADARINVICLGPGLGLGAGQAALLATALHSGRRLVLDADALTLLARDAGLFSALHAQCVLTPHAGEFARLFPDIAARLNAAAVTGPAFSKVDAVRQAAARAGCVVLLKGPDTVIADAAGRCCIASAQYQAAAPWLATAGAGDVLAGFIVACLARGGEALQAAAAGAWLHAECARSFGPGLISEDIAEEVPRVFRALGL